MKYKTFEDWYFEVENFSGRAERIDLPKTHEAMRIWLKEAFRAARGEERMILNISINTEDFSEVGQVQMPPGETADSLVDNWDACVTQAKRINAGEWTINDVIELMDGRGFKISIDRKSVPLFY